MQRGSARVGSSVFMEKLGIMLGTEFSVSFITGNHARRACALGLKLPHFGGSDVPLLFRVVSRLQCARLGD